MQFVKPDINVDFVGKRKIGFVVSALMLLLSLVALAMDGGPLYGIDFSGGTVIQVRFDAPTQVATVKKGLEAVGMESTTVQRFGEAGDNEYLIRADVSMEAEGNLTKELELLGV